MADTGTLPSCERTSGSGWKPTATRRPALQAVLLAPVVYRAGEELTDLQEGCKPEDIQSTSPGDQPCLGVRQ
jgi:hypothetical protein